MKAAENKYIISTGLIILLYFTFIFRYAVNAPLADDFYTVLKFLNDFYPAAFAEKIKLLFAQHNEHRLFFNRLTAVVFDAFGGVNFKYLILFGNILLLGLTWVFFLAFKEKSDKIKYFLPAVLILFQPQPAGSIFWATSILQNAGVFLFSALAVYFLASKKKYGFLTGTFFSVLAAFSAGSGLFVFAVGIVMLFSMKRVKEALYYIFIGVVIVLVYFYGYTLPAHAGEQYFRLNMITSPLTFLTLCGSAFVPNSRVISEITGLPLLNWLIAATTGLALSVWFFYLTKKKYYKVNPVIYFFFIYLFLTALVLVLTRGGVGILRAFSGRYRFISVLLVALSYISWLELQKKAVKEKYFRYLAAALLFCTLSYAFNLKEIKDCSNRLQFGITSWLAEKKGMELMNEPAAESAEILEKAIFLQHYKP